MKCNFFLNHIIILVGATNIPWEIDEAVLRFVDIYFSLTDFIMGVEPGAW